MTAGTTETTGGNPAGGPGGPVPRAREAGAARGDAAPAAEREDAAPGASGSPGPSEGARAEGEEAAERDSDRVGPGAEASEATGGLGQGSQRYGHVRDAFANVEGDVVGRDKYVVLLGGRKERLRRLSPLTVERVRFAYQEPGQLADAREVLTRRRVLLLRGPEGYGKTAMAVRLLLGLGDGPLYHLDSGVDLASLSERLEDHGGDIERGAGYLLDRPADLARLRGDVYEKVRGALSEADASLVVTVPDDEAPADSELLAGVVDLTDAPDRRMIVSRYLQWRLGDRTAGRLLAEHTVVELLDEQLDGDPPCRLAAELAVAVCDEYEAGAYGTGALGVERVRARLARMEAEDFDIWADGLGGVPLRCFAIALAVLNGLPQEHVARAARSLERRLGTDRRPVVVVGGDGRPPGGDGPFALPRRKQLTRLRARAVPDPDGAPGEALEYKDPAYARLVVLHAWSQYGIQDELLDWLGELVGDASVRVRAYAAAALGVLARASFEYVRDRALVRWRDDEDARRREAVAYALSLAAEDDRLRDGIAALTSDWYTDRDSPRSQATAARVYGMGLGPGTEGSVRALGRLTLVDRLTVAVAVGQGFTDLLAEERWAAPEVLWELVERVADHRSRPAALLAFLVIAAQWAVDGERWGDGRGDARDDVREDVRDAAEADGWPALLYLAGAESSLRDPLVLLWREALNQALFRPQTEQVLGNWAALAERDARFRDVFELMVGAVVHGDGRSGRILRQAVAEWDDPESLAPLPLTAAVVTTVLDRERV
ncbi:hypothetical protein F0L17_09930 [Streptomyces sp. TRM43335]|uniref:Uncharacterized protein n=1 Tax=Streptomyces taklimakanensis TaxID=2569853 RepID=A0A6G2BB06_9ACTN|nr:hypothetical protein [Streptomyces taklimakanensis]MTE19440.1 hypothetical protein [Streptomyces taklimakanensis]